MHFGAFDSCCEVLGGAAAGVRCAGVDIMFLCRTTSSSIVNKLLSRAFFATQDKKSTSS